MKQQENKELASSLPVLPRLDRLDFLLHILEEKHGLSGKHFRADTHVVKKGAEEVEDEYCKTQTVSLSSALEEVHHKGTLIERLTALENRVLQLSLEMDEGNTSRSSSSKSRYGSVARDDKDEKVNPKQKQLEEEAASTTEAASLSSRKTDKVVGNAKIRRKSYRKWRLDWFGLGCN
ncbi:hypothetical protein K7X08_019952 [Anisodus acutangulus]|uniref:Uncharacterized protein n=1 Tax=Anisodus acutangulus TaxID=402998 RepID=A0A9Q1MWR3_9SOLA|nr:hypothetical protein K7X08_019952 [Anisodus acutangulus]